MKAIRKCWKCVVTTVFMLVHSQKMIAQFSFFFGQKCSLCGKINAEKPICVIFIDIELSRSSARSHLPYTRTQTLLKSSAINSVQLFRLIFRQLKRTGFCCSFTLKSLDKLSMAALWHNSRHSYSHHNTCLETEVQHLRRALLNK